MGKIVKIAAGFAIAAGAIALAAPTGGLSIASALTAVHVSAGVAAFVGAIGAAVFATVATLALNALVPTPGSYQGRQSTRAQPTSDIEGKRCYPPGPSLSTMSPKKATWWREANFYPGARFAIVRTRGDCMKYTINGKYCVVDRFATIRAGDYFIFGVDDMADYLGHTSSFVPRSIRAGWCSGLGKRFVGIDPAERVVVFEHTFPLNRIETGLDRVTYACRVRAVRRTYLGAIAAWWQIRRDPEQFDSRLARPPYPALSS